MNYRLITTRQSLVGALYHISDVYELLLVPLMRHVLSKPFRWCHLNNCSKPNEVKMIFYLTTKQSLQKNLKEITNVALGWALTPRLGTTVGLQNYLTFF